MRWGRWKCQILLRCWSEIFRNVGVDTWIHQLIAVLAISQLANCRLWHSIMPLRPDDPAHKYVYAAEPVPWQGKTVVKSQMVHVEHPQSINKNGNGLNHGWKWQTPHKKAKNLKAKTKNQTKTTDTPVPDVTAPVLMSGSVAKVKVFLLARCNYIVNDFIIYLLN